MSHGYYFLFFLDQFTKHPNLKEKKILELQFGVTEKRMQREARGM